MFRIKSLTALAALSLGVIVAPLAHAQGGTTPTGTTSTEAAAPAAKPEPAKTMTAKSHTAKPMAMAKVDLNVGSSRVDLQACKLEYSIVSPK